MKRFYVAIIGLLVAYSVNGQLVLTIAGQLDSVGALNGAALFSHFNNPHGIAVDGFGNIYVADRFGHKIRKISTAGFVTTLAGSGIQGAADGVGTNASFNEPWGLCADSIGNVYVADTRNNKIRKIDTNGNVTTIAGTGNFGTTNGAGLSSTFGNPTGIERNKNTGILYVADHLTHIIRRIDPAGNVSTLAGMPFLTGTADGQGNIARFNRPYGLELDNNGNILVADEWNHTIRRVTPTGNVTTLAGVGTAGSQDGLSSVASFNYPWDIAVDANNNIFVADGYNDVIRKIDPLGNVTTYVGTAGNSGSFDATGAAATFNGATGIAYFDDTDELYVADAYNQLIRKIINLNIQTVAVQITNNTTNSIFCEYDSIKIRAVPEIYDNYTFSLNGVVYQNSASEYFTTTGLSAGNYLLNVTAIHNGNTIVGQDIFFQVAPTPNPSITVVGSTSFFAGDSVKLIVSAGTDYLWNTGSTNGVITVFNGGSYWADVTNNNGCVGRSDTVVVTVTQFSPTPTISFVLNNVGDNTPVNISQDGSVGTVCYGKKAVLRSSYNSNNQWFKDGFPIQNAISKDLIVTSSGDYSVQVTDTLGFILSSNVITVNVLNKQIINFTAAPLVAKPLEDVVFNANVSSDVTNYFWSFGEPAAGSSNYSTTVSPTHRYNSEGIYTISLITTDMIGCADTLTKAAYVTISEDGVIPNPDNDGIIFIPSAFTPNGDGRNDVFYVRGADITKIDLSIYNQWGERVFYSDTQTEGWDGTHDGTLAQLGTYTYVARVELKDGTKTVYKGHVTILK
jgi:gliding motility-associated-like protein